MHLSFERMLCLPGHVPRFRAHARHDQRVQYEQTCSGSDAFDPGCLELMKNLEQAEGHVDVYLHLPLSVYAQGSWYMRALLVGYTCEGSSWSTPIACFVHSNLVYIFPSLPRLGQTTDP